MRENRNGFVRMLVSLRDNGGTSYGGKDTSLAQLVQVVVRSRPQVPVLTLAPNPLPITEGAGGRIVRGFFNVSLHLESHPLQTLVFRVLPVNPDKDFSYFEQVPVVTPGGDLVFRLKEFAFGEAQLFMQYVGTDGAANDSVAVTTNLTMQIAPINNAPSFVLPLASVAVNEGWAPSLVQTVDNVVASILPRQDVPDDVSGPRGEDWAEQLQSVTFVVVVHQQDQDIVEENGDSGIEISGAYPSLNGALRLALNPNMNGLVVLNLTAVDSANGSSPVQQLRVEVLPVNDEPRIDVECAVSSVVTCFAPASGEGGLLVRVSENCAQGCPDDGGEVDGYGASVCAGRRFSLAGLLGSSASLWDSGDENNQELTFNVTLVDSHVDPDTGYASLFSVPPTVRQADGRLTLCLNQDANGNATFAIVLMDSGGRVRGGIDQSRPVTLSIEVSPVNQAPIFSVPGPLFILWAGMGSQSFANFATNISKGNTDGVMDREASQAATFHIALAAGASRLFQSDAAVDAQGTLHVQLAHYQVGTVQSSITLVDDGGADGASRNTSDPAQVLLAVVDSVLLLKVSIKGADVGGQTDEQLRAEAAEAVSTLLTVEPGWIQVGAQRLSGDQSVHTLVCGACSGEEACANASETITAESPWAGEGAVSFSVRVLVPDANFTWVDRALTAAETPPWMVSWAKHFLHSNCGNEPSVELAGTPLAHESAGGVAGVAEYNMSVVFDEVGAASAGLVRPGFLSKVVAPRDVAVDAGGYEMVVFEMTPVAHRLFGAADWTTDASDGGLMLSAPQVLRACNTSHSPRFREVGECQGADLLISPKPFWNGRVVYRLSMRGWSRTVTFELEVLPVNQVPSFQLQPIVYVGEDSGSIELPGVASLVAAGPPVVDELQQNLTFDLFLIEGRNDTVESIALDIDRTNGRANSTAWLKLRTRADRNGELVFNVSLRDEDALRNDSTASPAARMTLVVVAANDEPVWALNCSSNESSPLHIQETFASFAAPGLAQLAGQELLGCAEGVEASRGCRALGSSSCAILLHMDENCDDCAGRQVLPEGGGSCFSAPHLVMSQLSPSDDPDESSQNLTFVFERVSSDPALPDQILTQPLDVVQASGALTFCLREDANGVAMYQMKAVDDGGGAPFGRNESEVALVELRVRPVNQAPSFRVCCDSMITLWTGGVQVLESFADTILKGRVAADGSDRESHQAATFSVVAGVDTAHLFAAAPRVSATGVLTASLLPAVPGMFSISVYLTDDGGTYGLGENRSQIHNVSIAVVDSYVAFRVSLDPVGMMVSKEEMVRFARQAVRQVLAVPFPHWVATCGNHSLFNATICQNESAILAFEETLSNNWPSSLNTLDLPTIYVLARSGSEAVHYSLQSQEVGQALRAKVVRTLQVEALPIRRNLQQQPSFEVNPSSLSDIREVDTQGWSPDGASAPTFVRPSFLINVVAPQHVPYNLDAQEHVMFELRTVGHRLFGREEWSMDGTDGGIMVRQTNVTADCQPLCGEATLTFAAREFWNGEVLYEVHMLSTDVRKNFTIFIRPVNQRPMLNVSRLFYLPLGETSLVDPVAFNIIAGPQTEDERAQLLQIFVQVSVV
jgi:hypothetical protein